MYHLVFVCVSSFDKIVNRRSLFDYFKCRRSKAEDFSVKWQGYPETENTWEPKENLNPQLIKEYLKTKNIVVPPANNYQSTTYIYRSKKEQSPECTPVTHTLHLHLLLPAKQFIHHHFGSWHTLRLREYYSRWNLSSSNTT